MTIDALHTLAPAGIYNRGTGTARQSVGNDRFSALLHSALTADGENGPKAQQAAAELLRIEMMQRSLSLAAEVEATAAPSGVRALETLLSCLGDGNPPGNPAFGRERFIPTEADRSASRSAGASEDISATASRFIGTPYRFGGEGGEGIDCSSFVQQVFREHQITLPRTVQEQIQVGSDVAAGELQKGDLVFFQTYDSYPSHVGIYLGEGKMIHASSARGEVTVSDISSAYYRSRFLGAKRIV